MKSSNRCKNNHIMREYKKYLCVPTKSGVRNFNSILSYFMYYAPYIDSAHCKHILSEKDAKEAYDKIMKKSDIGKYTKIIKRVRQDSYKKFDLEGDKICLECNRMIFDKYSNEIELQALLRHIRNSLAHGFVYIYRNKKKKSVHIFLQDYDSNKKKITAKIVVDFSLLNDWKAIIENYYVIGE